MVTGYFDDSSTHKGSKIYALCGFLGGPQIWDDFDREWNKVLGKPEWPNRPREVHCYDCVHEVKEFDGWSFAQRLAVFGDLANVICESNVMAIGSLIVVDAFEKLPSHYKVSMAQGGLSGPMDFCVSIPAASRNHRYPALCPSTRAADCRGVGFSV